MTNQKLTSRQLADQARDNGKRESGNKPAGAFCVVLSFFYFFFPLVGFTLTIQKKKKKKKKKFLPVSAVPPQRHTYPNPTFQQCAYSNLPPTPPLHMQVSKWLVYI